MVSSRVAMYIQNRLREERGQAMVEYALIIGLVSVVAVGALTIMGGSVNAMYTTISTALTNVPLP
jgi:pilus assembly protein Flp/PilA